MHVQKNGKSRQIKADTKRRKDGKKLYQGKQKQNLSLSTLQQKMEKTGRNFLKSKGASNGENEKDDPALNNQNKNSIEQHK